MLRPPQLPWQLSFAREAEKVADGGVGGGGGGGRRRDQIESSSGLAQSVATLYRGWIIATYIQFNIHL